MNPPSRNVLVLVIGGIVLLTGLSGCFSLNETAVDPDDRFGHRVDGETADGRRTIVIQPPDTERTYRFFPATIQTVNIRPAPIDANAVEAGVSVEILVKGAFPDACTDLHDVQQERTANIVRIDLQMRRPTGAVCASVLRPYRFYLELEGRYAIGAYSLFVNDASWPFEITANPDTRR